MELHDEPRPRSRDLMDVAMRAAWRQGGRIRTLSKNACLQIVSGPLLARLRYCGALSAASKARTGAPRLRSWS